MLIVVQQASPSPKRHYVVVNVNSLIDKIGLKHIKEAIRFSPMERLSIKLHCVQCSWHNPLPARNEAWINNRSIATIRRPSLMLTQCVMGEGCPIAIVKQCTHLANSCSALPLRDCRSAMYKVLKLCSDFSLISSNLSKDISNGQSSLANHLLRRALAARPC